jgi:hypothetical protein
VRARQDLTVQHNDCADRHLIRDIRSDSRLFKSEPHKALIVI